MSTITKKIYSIDIEEELKRSYLDYAMSVIIERALPDVRDGLKPVHRRILFAMYALGNNWNKPYKKSARIVGDVIGKYHPHGDTAVYDTIVRMAQSFSLRYMLVDGQGNFGSVDGDPAAAMRYTEIRMSKISHELLSDLEKETVDYVLNYDGSEKIPNVMPTKIPNLLINGSSGIAVGMATNIPPHNLSEVIDGCLAFIDNENITLEELMKYIPGPDFPTSAIITGNKLGLADAYRTGRGKIDIRANVEVETDANTGRETIIINEIPYQVNKSKLMEKFYELVKEKRIEGISGLRDESDKDGMRIVIELKRESVSEVVLNNLYSLTQLQVSYSMNMVALYQGEPKLLPLKDILLCFVNHRREIITRRTIFELRKTRDRAHILEALSIALVNIDPMMNIIRQSSTVKEAKNGLMSNFWLIDNCSILSLMLDLSRKNIISSEFIEKRNCIDNGKYYFTDQQAQAILDLRLQNLTKLENKNIINEYKNLLFYIDKLICILRDPEHLNHVIREELVAIKTQYNDSRRTQINFNSSTLKIEDLINREDVVVTLSNQGYIKYKPIKDYGTQKRGGKGKSAIRIKQEDFIDCLLVANTHDTILMFSNRGKVYKINVYQLSEASNSARGRPISNFLPIETGESITAIFPIRKYKEEDYIIMVTENGIIKKTFLKEFIRRQRNYGIVAINLNNGDKLIGVDITDGTNEIMLFSSFGKVVRFSENQIRSMGRMATGVKGIKLSQGDRVVSILVPRNDGCILTVTKNGYGKLTNISEFLKKSRATRGVISLKVNKKNGPVIGSVQARNCDQIMIITNSGMLVRIQISDINIMGRNTQGVMLIRTTEGEQVVSLQVIVKSVDETLSDIIN